MLNSDSPHHEIEKVMSFNNFNLKKNGYYLVNC